MWGKVLYTLISVRWWNDKLDQVACLYRYTIKYIKYHVDASENDFKKLDILQVYIASSASL